MNHFTTQFPSSVLIALSKAFTASRNNLINIFLSIMKKIILIRDYSNIYTVMRTAQNQSCPDSTRRAMRSISASSAFESGSYVLLSDAPNVQAKIW